MLYYTNKYIYLELNGISSWVDNIYILLTRKNNYKKYSIKWHPRLPSLPYIKLNQAFLQNPLPKFKNKLRQDMDRIP